MTDEHRPTPNSYLGDVYWWSCCFFGTLEFIAQDFLGMLPKASIPDRKFLDTKIHSADFLRDFFDEVELPDGRLALELHMDDYRMNILATIETKFMFGDEISDEDFIRLVDDFVAYARTRPIVDSDKREGAEITDEDIEQMTQHETLEEHDFWSSLPTVVTEHCGLPHYLWFESLEHQTQEE